MPATTPPTVPTPEHVTIPEMPTSIDLQLPFQPVSFQDYLGFSGQQFDQSLGQQQQLWAQQLMYMRPFAEAMSELNTELAPAYAQTMFDVESKYGPQMAQLYSQMLNQANPAFMPNYMQVGNEVMKNLQSGYELGPGLTHEMEQAIRSSQAARGNWLGNAPSAQEIAGMGQASLNMYNTRLGQAQNFLNSKQPTDMFGQLRASTSTYQPVNAAVPNPTWMNPTVAPSVFGTVANSQSNYNQTAASTQASLYGSYTSGLVNAANVNNEGAFSQYQAQLDQFLYRQSVNQGLYSAPSTGGAGGMGMMGGVMSGVGTGMMGLAASGVIGTGATAGAVGIAGAAAGAAAAICWYARKLIPDKWKSFRKYIFTLASDEERRDYLYNSRRLANALA